MELEIWHFVLLFVAAFLGGFIDAIAGGGGLISLPALIICGIPPHMALATNKLQGIFGSLVASLNFARKGLVNFKEIIIGAVCTFAGGCIGANLILIINADFLKFLIPVMLMVILVYTIFSPQIGEIERQAKIKTRTFYIIFGLGLGFYDGFFGPGAGSFWTFSFIGVLGIGMKKAVAHTKVLNFVSSMASLIVFIVA